MGYIIYLRNNKANLFGLTPPNQLYILKLLSGLYIHIPYCRKACIYCDFHFSTVHKNKKQLLLCIQNEIALRESWLPKEPLESIYFGGGTPSICTDQEIGGILDLINKHFKISSNCEITLEANPDDLTREKTKALKQMGVNRLSIGIQSFFEEDLIWMNRAHNAMQAKACIENAQDAGIINISADIIFATPLLSMKKLEENLKTLIAFNIPHLSCYNLTVEEKTGLYHQVKTKKIEVVNDDQASVQFYFIRSYLQQHSYEHYEISNYAKPGYYSRHNTAYWQGNKYLGVGPSAHSFNGTSRSWNIANNEKYIKLLSQNELALETELLTVENRFNEILLTGLRTKWGIDIAHLQSQFQLQYSQIATTLKIMLERGELLLHDNKLSIAPEYWVMADGLVASLFII